ncbi:MAG: lamin tail domain-containing protein, partial [Bacteroidetes bacterium]|nr:lamin tail domain-containing protein [Bacteroidota bacterium]
MIQYRVIAFVLTSLVFFSAHAQLYINEWMASNSSVINDPDFGESSDWIEIYHVGIDTADLSGYFLSDNLDNPEKWAFPSGTKLAPGDFLLIWADGRDSLLHTNFGLTREGEEIGLFDPSG